MTWYIAQTRAGAMRAASERIGLPQERRGETIVERSLRDAGFDCYLPRTRFETRHRRTHKIVTHCKPLIVGYVFVDGVARHGVSVRDCDGVSRILGDLERGWPYPVPDETVERFRRAEADMEFDDTREARIKRGLEARTKRDTIRLQFPAGSRVAVTAGPLAGFHGKVTSVTGRAMVRAMIELFGGLTPVELPVDAVEVAA